MKIYHYCWLMLLFAAMGCKQKPATVKTNFIEFIHTGVEDKPMLPLVISSQKVKAPLSRIDSQTIRTIVKAKEIDDATRAQFQRQVVTDAKTYQTVLDFLNKNDNYYTNDTKVNRGDAADYNVNIEGDTKEVYYRTSREFFDALLKQLQSTGADKKVIDQVDSIGVRIGK